MKAGDFHDLLTGDGFGKDDIILLQGSEGDEKRANVNEFYAVKKKLTPAAGSHASNVRNVSGDTSRILNTIGSRTASTTASGSEFLNSSAYFRFSVGLIFLNAISGGANQRQEVEKALDAAKRSEPPPSSSSSSQMQVQQKNYLYRAPPSRRELHFKPGASTWDSNTDPKGEEDQEITEDQHGKRTRVNTYRTTGAMSASFTSTNVALSTKNYRLVEEVARQPESKASISMIS